MKNREFKDLSHETRVFSQRAIIVWCLLLVVVVGLVVRLFYLQVLQHEHYATISDNNRILLQPLAPNRGLIFDRNGELLADNRASHSLNITPERVADFETTLNKLRRILPISDGEVEDFRKRLKQTRRPYQPVPLRYKLSEEEIARLAVRNHLFPGVSIEAELVRFYPHAAATAHVLGYVGRINEEELKIIDPTNYSATQSMGKLGLEKFYEELLHGQVGYQKVETNARGRVLRVLERSAPVPGSDITLYLDIGLQRVAEEALAGRRGAVVAIDTQTGGILAMVSNPSFDPNLFVTGIDFKSYKELRDSPDLPLFNRALRGRYPPGSTIKPMVGLAAIEAGYTTWERQIWDPGYYQLSAQGRRYRDWNLKVGGHGRIDLYNAVSQSCDTYFYELSHRMGIDIMSDFLAKFGFGRNTLLDSEEALGGILPSSEWKRGALGEPWYTGDSLNASIGQGYMLATPMQLATATAVMANRGKWVQPKLMEKVGTPFDLLSSPQPHLGRRLDQAAGVEVPKRELAIEDIQLSYEGNWERMVDAMEDVIHGSRGTARALAKGLNYRMAAKSGTAQVVGIKQDEVYDAEKVAERNRDHALFIAFAPADAPRIAVAVIVENGGGGGSTAGPIAKTMLDAYLIADGS